MKSQLMMKDIKKPKFLMAFSIFYVLLILLTVLVENRVIAVGPLHVLSGSLIIPFSFMLGDVITEVYGYREMRRLIWVAILGLYFVTAVLDFIMILPSPSNQIAVNHDYQVVLSPFQKNVFCFSVAAIASSFLNSYVLSKWKILIKGRFFWMRSLGSSFVGEIIFIFTWALLGFINEFPLMELLELMAVSYAYKVVCNLIGILPISIFTKFIKRSECLDTYDYGIKFNPFRVSV